MVLVHPMITRGGETDRESRPELGLRELVSSTLSTGLFFVPNVISQRLTPMAGAAPAASRGSGPGELTPANVAGPPIDVWPVFPARRGSREPLVPQEYHASPPTCRQPWTLCRTSDVPKSPPEPQCCTSLPT